MSADAMAGGCQCGAVRYRIVGAPAMTALCHCTMCRRAHAAPVVAWALYEAAQVAFEGAPPRSFESSPGCKRSFCARCGTPLAFTAAYLPGLVDIAIGSLDQPAAVAPAFHYWDSERLPWLQPGDGLPRHPAFPPMDDTAAGS